MPTLPLLLAALLILLITIFLRLLLILPSLQKTPHPRPPRSPGTPTHLLIVLGSGGHTAEMFSLLANLDPKRYTHRSYVVSSGDEFSERRAEEFERGMGERWGGGGDTMGRKGEEKGKEKEEEEGKEKEKAERNAGIENGFSIHLVPRARHIHQPLPTTPLTSLHCLLSCLHLLSHHPHGYPDLILTNGPATALILILAATLIRFFAFMPGVGGGKGRAEEKMRTIYVESWARVKRPSLSGRIIVYCGLCNRVLVQWKGLERGGWGEYRGMLVR